MLPSQSDIDHEGNGEADKSTIPSDQFAASQYLSYQVLLNIEPSGRNKISSKFSACNIELDLSEAADFTYEIDPNNPSSISFAFKVTAFQGVYTS